ncbi:MAG: hypothetical protein HYT50_00545 [Candidatus Wildermuthbacteria bacterium]|nr:hypothetical protein [Candidatus Wildermuthbacteria bacterium]
MGDRVFFLSIVIVVFGAAIGMTVLSELWPQYALAFWFAAVVVIFACLAVMHMRGRKIRKRNAETTPGQKAEMKTAEFGRKTKDPLS